MKVGNSMAEKMQKRERESYASNPENHQATKVSNERKMNKDYLKLPEKLI
jgi:hypothetical protein